MADISKSSCDASPTPATGPSSSSSGVAHASDSARSASVVAPDHTRPAGSAPTGSPRRVTDAPADAPSSTAGRGPGQGASTGSTRLAWVDAAKGLSIVGVCLMHVVTGVPGGQDTWLGQFSGVLDPLRMPLFFLLSGLFSHRVLERSLPDLFLRRLWFLLIPYLVFSPFQAAIRLGIDGNRDLEHILLALIVGDPGLWFLYALIAYNLAAWALRGLPSWLAVAVSTVPLLVCIGYGLVDAQWPRNLVQYAPIFFIGLHYRRLFFSIAAKAKHVWTILGSIAIFTACELVYRALRSTVWQEWSSEVAAQSTFFTLFRNIGALPLGVLVGVWLAHVPVVRHVLIAVGKNTLPVYASHHIMLHVVNAVVVPELVLRIDGMDQWYSDISVRLLTGVLTCVLSGLFFYGIGKVPVARWILYPPALPWHKPATQPPSTAAQPPSTAAQSGPSNHRKR